MNRTALEVNLEKLHKTSLLWAISCCGGNRKEAEDVLQTTYLKIMEGRAQFGEKSSFKTWLFSVIRMTANENRRKVWLRSALLDRWTVDTKALQSNEDSRSESVVENKQEKSQVLLALSELPQRQREVLELVFYHELSIAEAAIAMKVSIGSARVHYDRGKKGLKDNLKKRGVQLE